VAKKDFFAAQTQGSEVKTEIVRKYFGAWAGVMVNNARKKGFTKIGYADLFAGRGRYRDGSKSTPILILESAIRDQAVREMLVCLFNDSDPEKATALEKEIQQIPGINLLTHPPRVISSEVNDALAEQFERISTIPTLYFLDPWGYKHISLRLIKAVLRPAGCDCIFFFNYNRVNAALSNPEMDQNMNSFFGKRLTLKNYRDAINKLDSEGKVQTDPPAEKRLRAGKLTLSDKVRVIFSPERKENGS
jgi:three-Cys-motif partner protein